MEQIQGYEAQGARAREARADDGLGPVPALRALSWLGAALIVAAAVLVTVPFQTPHATEAGYKPLQSLAGTTVVVAVVLACTGVVVIAVRVAAGAVIRSLRSS